MYCDCNAGDICCFCWFYLITTWQFPHGQLRLKSFLILNSDATRGTSSSSQNLYELRQWINGLLTSYDFHRCWSTSRSLIHKSHHFVGFLNPRSYHVWWWKNPRFSVVECFSNMNVHPSFPVPEEFPPSPYNSPRNHQPLLVENSAHWTCAAFRSFMFDYQKPSMFVGWTLMSGCWTHIIKS